MLSARLARFALLGLLVTGTAYAADSSEIDPEKAAAPAQAALEQAPAPQPVAAGPDEAATAENVGRATITTGVMDREPVDSVDTVTNDQEQIFFFTEILNLTGGTITHRWEYNGEIMAEVPLDIGGPRWRTHSTMFIVAVASFTKQFAGGRLYFLTS